MTKKDMDQIWRIAEKESKGMRPALVRACKVLEDYFGGKMEDTTRANPTSRIRGF